MHWAPLVPPGVGIAAIAALLIAAAPTSSTPLGLAGMRASPPTAVVDAVVREPEGGDTDDLGGSLSGGEQLVLRGTGLTAVTAVRVGTERAVMTESTNTEIVVEVPHAADWSAGSARVDIVLGGSARDTGFAWTYRVETPVDRQLEYAFRHWDTYNIAFFGDFNAWGGDCMNFVSQTLVARGWPMTDEWYNLAQVDWADPFVHVPSFDEWLAAHPELGAVKYTLEEGRGLARLGDIVVFDWDGDGSLDHAQVVSSLLGDGDDTRIALVGHNRDTTYRDVDGALLEQGTSEARAWIWALP